MGFNRAWALLPFFVGTTSAATEHPGLPWGHTYAGVDRAWQTAESAGVGYQGEGARILMLDTGIVRSLPSILEQFVEGRFLGLDPPGDPPAEYDFFDFRGHGVGVASVLVGKPDGKGKAGLAPRAKLWVGKQDVRTVARSLARGIRWAIDVGVDVVNISLSTSPNDSPEDLEELSQSIHRARAAGVAVVAAAGNGGATPLGQLAAHPSVLSVGAIDSDGTRAYFSQFGPELDFMAPAVGIPCDTPNGAGRKAVVKISTPDGEPARFPVAEGFSRSPLGQASGLLAYVEKGSREDFEGFSPGMIAVAERDLPAGDVAREAARAGARAVLVLDRMKAFSIGYAPLTDPETSIPVAYIEKSVSDPLREKLQRGYRGLRADLEIVPSSIRHSMGTSLAAPFLSGVVALMKAAHPALSFEQVQRILKRTATSPPRSENSAEFGYGILNVEQAVAEALRMRAAR